MNSLLFRLHVNPADKQRVKQEQERDKNSFLKQTKATTSDTCTCSNLINQKYNPYKVIQPGLDCSKVVLHQTINSSLRFSFLKAKYWITAKKQSYIQWWFSCQQIHVLTSVNRIFLPPSSVLSAFLMQSSMSSRDSNSTDLTKHKTVTSMHKSMYM